MSADDGTLYGYFLDPDWNEGGRVHNWRNYISEEVRGMWQSFTIEQRAALVRQADQLASDEEWD